MMVITDSRFISWGKLKRKFPVVKIKSIHESLPLKQVLVSIKQVRVLLSKKPIRARTSWFQVENTKY